MFSEQTCYYHCMIHLRFFLKLPLFEAPKVAFEYTILYCTIYFEYMKYANKYEVHQVYGVDSYSIYIYIYTLPSGLYTFSQIRTWFLQPFGLSSHLLGRKLSTGCWQGCIRWEGTAPFWSHSGVVARALLMDVFSTSKWCSKRVEFICGQL